MFDSFLNTAEKTPDAVFFRFEEADGSELAVTYRQARARVRILEQSLVHTWGLQPGAAVACDMENCPEFVYLILACEAGKLTLVTLNHRLSDSEKTERLQSAFPSDSPEPAVLTAEQVAKAIADGQQAEVPTGTADSGTDSSSDASSEALPAIIMFTSGTTGHPKAAHLGFDRLEGSAEAYNRAFACTDTTRWQVALPLYHVGGLQMVVRSVLNGTPFVLYRRFDAGRVLDDAARFHATHVSVVDKILRDLLAAATDGESPQADVRLSALRSYRCILLGGAAPNPMTIQASRAQQAHVFASYGMTETCSLVAACPIEWQDGAALALIDGYEACIADPDEAGRGQLGVRGPGVFDGYLNSRASFTADGFFLTGDMARMKDGRLYLSERLQDMFVSGGENVYPEEIRKKILSVPGVTDAYVFGAEDPTWGRRPVAFVEMADAQVLPDTAAHLADGVKTSLKVRLSKLNQPDRLYVVDSLPRTGIGKVDAQALRASDAAALDIREVRVHRIRQPFVKPVRTARELLRGRESLLVEVVDAAGRIGTGEDTAFSSDWYLPETIPDDLRFLERQAIPCLLSQSYLQPDAVYGSLSRLPDADGHMMAISALETALWDLYGIINQRTMTDLIGARNVWDVRGQEFTLTPGYAPGGVVIGLMGISQTVAAAKEAYEAGYLRVKLKIRPGDDQDRVAAVRRALPDVILMLDANQSYTDKQLPKLRALDQYRCAGIEEPLDPNYIPKDGPRDLFARLANLQQAISTPIFLDESIATPADAQRALTFPDLRGYVMKIGKWGGVLPAVDFYWQARRHGATVWMGGMFDTGISKRLHAAFTMLPGVTLPGDVNDTLRYFPHDVTTPPLVMEDGCVLINPPEAPYGLGCRIDYDELEKVLVETRTYRRGCLPSVRRAAGR
ncbi:MAG: o-succinylbenzoate synthase [Eggerthellaceae bacterium]|jgi:O-succinylbenzoate synthase